MTIHTITPFCIVCRQKLPYVPRAEALRNGTATEIGKTYYHHKHHSR